MAVDIKVAPEEKLELVQTLIVDSSVNSEYFNISELPDSFSGGKNAFLIAGSDLLAPNSEIKIQIRDAAGNIVYHEFSDGSPTEYYEGNSKVVAVYVYPTTTAFGPATITVLGELNTKNVNVPIDWQNKYNVKWTGRFNINPALSNTTRVRFKKRPEVSIKELLQPLYSIISGSKVASMVTQSFAAITINQLDTFAGDVARVKVFRTSVGDISDYDLIQDISIESKNLLTTYALSGSVVGNAGLFGPDSLKKVWNTSSLHAVLDSTYVSDGLQLTGSGTFSFTSSLSLLSSNTYELQLDTFYTGSTTTNLVAYISGTQNGIYPITTFSGSTPTKNFGTTTTAFKISNDEPTASLYLSQSSVTNQWHVGNISLNLSQDTAFSPNEVSFITSMPTVLGNETFNFKFEFYDINNNYVPVAVTASAVFNGGNNNLGKTLVFISSSVTELSQSVSGTIGNVTASVSQSFVTSSAYSASLQSSSLYISSSISGTISNVSSSLSSSISASKAAAISSSFGNIQSLANGNFSGSFISDTTVYAPVIGGTTGYISNLFKVGTSPSIYLDARQNPRKIFIGGVSDSGSYNNSNTNVYMDSTGKFSLGNQMSWDGSTLTVNGTINVTGGNAATSASAYTMATTSANSAYSNASSSAFTMAAGAYSNASHSAYLSANTAYQNAKTIADNIANGSYSGGTLISGQSIVSPIIAGADGYFSNTVKVGGTSALTISGLNKAIYAGAGNFNSADTGFYMNDGGYFSLSNKLNFNAANNTLTVNGNITTISGNIGGWIIADGYLRSSNSQTYLYSNGYIELKDTAGQNKITIDSSATLPSPTAGSDSGNIVVPSQTAETAYISGGTVSGGTSPLLGPDGNGYYGIGWSQQVWFTPTISGYYEFTTWFPKNNALGATGTSGTALMGLRAYIYDAAGNSLINDDGREYIEGPVEGAGVNAVPPSGRPYYVPGTYGNQYERDGTGAYFSNQYLTAGVPVRFLIQWIVFNIRNTDTLTIKSYWPATNVQYISNVPKTNINQQGFQVIQDTNRYLTIRPSRWYMYNDPVVYGASPPAYLNDQGVTEVMGVMGGTMVVLNATDKGDWHSSKQKQYIRSAQYSFANRAAGGNFLTSWFFGGYGRSFNLTRAYGWFQPNTNTGFTTYEGSWWPYAYNIESIVRISYGKFQVTFAEAVMDSYGAYNGGGTYSVYLGMRTTDSATQFQQAGISNMFHTGFTMDLGVETPDNRFVSILIIS